MYDIYLITIMINITMQTNNDKMNIKTGIEPTLFNICLQTSLPFKSNYFNTHMMNRRTII